MSAQVQHATAAGADRELVLERLFDAPPELVFEAWTQPAHIGQWWGPNGFTTTTHQMDVRPGGVWRFTMHGPDGRDWPNRITYEEVARPQRLVYAHEGDDDSDPNRFHVTVTFTDRGGRTHVRMCLAFPTAEDRERVVREHGADEGGNQTLARLAAYLVVMQRA